MAKDDIYLIRPPEKKNVKIWRYLDFAKFMSILDKRALFFSNIKDFEDPYEGRLSLIDLAKYKRQIENMWKLIPDPVANLLPPNFAEITSDFNFYIQCYTCGKLEPKEAARVESDISDVVEKNDSDSDYAISLDNPRLKRRFRTFKVIQWD